MPAGVKGKEKQVGQLCQKEFSTKLGQIVYERSLHLLRQNSQVLEGNIGHV